jgi:quinol monooxygenase YgiN
LGIDDSGGIRVRPIFRVVLANAILTAMLAEPAHAQDSAVYLATYIEVMPNAVDSGTALLERYRDVSRKEDGNLRFDMLHEIARPNRFAILEVWKDKAALEGHDKAASTLGLRDRLTAIQSAPPDERINSLIYGVPVKSEHRAGTIFVLTHVDVMPVHKDDCLALLRAMSIDILKDDGYLDYQVLQQENRGNHFTVLEEWTSRKALDAHAMAAHTRAFRERLSPMLGALYDERFYNELN